METMRTPFQGVWNIVRFNWHFYLLAIVLVIVMMIGSITLPAYNIFWLIVIGLVIAPAVISLVVSYYVYDLSDLYRFKWLDDLSMSKDATIINIHAGFDETSVILHAKFRNTALKVFDFYDPVLHTEPSIKRARKAYPVFANTESIKTTSIPVNDHSVDYIFVIFSAHEIRSNEERDLFFKELKRTIKPSGKIIVVEHLRDIVNFAAYNVGFMHFMSRVSWIQTFDNVRLVVSKEIKITSFITTFILE